MYKVLLAVLCVAVFVQAIMATASFPTGADYLTGYPQKNKAFTPGGAAEPQYFFASNKPTATDPIVRKQQLVTAELSTATTKPDHRTPYIGFVVDEDTVTGGEIITDISVFVATDASFSTLVSASASCNLYVGDACYTSQPDRTLATGNNLQNFNKAYTDLSTAAAVESTGFNTNGDTITLIAAGSKTSLTGQRIFQWVNFTLTTPYTLGADCTTGTDTTSTTVVAFATVLCFDTTGGGNLYVPTYLEYDSDTDQTVAGQTGNDFDTDPNAGLVNINNGRIQAYKNGKSSNTNLNDYPTNAVYYQAYGTDGSDQS